jgi:DNA-binding NarL/FixJ family response regulator
MERTVLIVDDHPGFRASARALLEADGYVVAGEAADGAEAVAAAGALQPEIVLLDVALPDLDGFAVAVLLAALGRPPQVILVSSRERSVYGRRIDAAPVRGFLPKRALSGAAIRELVG